MSKYNAAVTLIQHVDALRELQRVQRDRPMDVAGVKSAAVRYSQAQR